MQKPVEWSPEKNDWLRRNRGLCFEDVLVAMGEGGLITKEKHRGQLYLHQNVYVVRMKGYVFAVPFVEDEEKIFLKTIFPSRRYAKKYLKDSL